MSSSNTFSRVGLEARRLAVRNRLKEELTILSKRRAGLFQVYRYDEAREKRRKAFENIKNIDERIRVIERTLKDTNRRAIRALADSVDRGPKLSSQSGNVAKITYVKPLRG